MAMYKIAPAIPLVLLGGLIVKILWLPSEAALQGGVILLNDTRLTHNLGEFGCNQTIGVGEKCPNELDFFLVQVLHMAKFTRLVKDLLML